jgi:type IV pilus assembly protein PilC
MALINVKGAGKTATRKQGSGFLEGQRMAKLKTLERQAKRKRIKLRDLAVFTQQLAAMLEAGLPLISALEALEEQSSNPHFQVIIRNVKKDVSTGTAFSKACMVYPHAFPNIFVSMVEAGEASGGLAEILEKTAGYFEDSVKLTSQVKSALMYPIAVILLAVGLVNVLLIFVIPQFATMFADFGEELPAPTKALIGISGFLQGNILFIAAGLIGFLFVWKRFVRTPRGRFIKDSMIRQIPILGDLNQKINLSRFCRTYAILMRSGVPILQTLDIVGKASGNVFIERSCRGISRHVSAGGQVSEILGSDPYFPPMVRHMSRAGERVGNVDGMLLKVSDFYDAEIRALVAGLTSLMEPILICFLGIVIGGIVIAMFLPIFRMGTIIN